MSDLAQLQAAFVKADDAGNKEDAQAFADEIRRLSGPSMADKIAADPISQGANNVLAAGPAELVMGSAPGRFASGAAKLPLGAAQLASRVVGGSKTIDDMIKNVDETTKHGREAYGDRGWDMAGLTGEILGPGILGVAKALPAATNAFGGIVKGMGIGGMTGLASPVTDTENFAKEKAVQTGIGTVAGGTIPLITKALMKAYQLGHGAIEHWLPGGPEAILRRGREKLLGDDPAAKEAIIKALANAKTVVPGSEPTAGEAIAHIPEATGIAAHQKFISRQPGVSPDFVAREADQFSARKGAADTIDRIKSIINEVPPAPAAAPSPLILPANLAAERQAAADAATASASQAREGLVQKLGMHQADLERNLASDLARRRAYEALASKTSIGSEGQASASGYLPHVSWTARVVDALRRAGTRSANDKINRTAADQYLDPARLAEALKDLPIAQRSKIVEQLLRESKDLLPSLGSAIESGLPATSPAQLRY